MESRTDGITISTTPTIPAHDPLLAALPDPERIEEAIESDATLRACTAWRDPDDLLGAFVTIDRWAVANGGVHVTLYVGVGASSEQPLVGNVATHRVWRPSIESGRLEAARIVRAWIERTRDLRSAA